MSANSISRAPEASPAKVVLGGNPNVGKTSIFNRLTGQRARVGNYPGVTIERRAGAVSLPSGRSVELVDAPGTYSLAARSADEQVTLWELVGHHGSSEPKAVVAVVDAGQLAKSLYLVVQILELGIPLVVALNMSDEVEDGTRLAERLELGLGVPVVPTVGSSGEGLDDLLQRLDDVIQNPAPFVPRLDVRYPEALRRLVDEVAEALPAAFRGSVERQRALGLWALSSLGADADDELEAIPDALRSAVARALASGFDVDLAVAEARYRAIDQLLDGLAPERIERREARSERIDRFLLHPAGGFLVLALTMFAVFSALFSWANPLIEWIETLFGALGSSARAVLPPGVLTDLLVEGVIGGVGNVLVFLPQILLLFLFIGLLEDSGYMARVAYLIDRVMRTLGLHGRAFVPMLSGFACAVPAILSTRTLERKRDRLLTMMVVPLMTCSARLPVYSLVIGAMFPPVNWLGVPLQAALLLFMYLFGIAMSLATAWVLGQTLVRGTKIPLILELPPYRLPRLRPTLQMLKGRGKEFVTEAGTVILAATVVLWVLLSFPKASVAVDVADGRTAKAEVVEGPSAIESSYGGRFAKAIEPVMKPLGFDWRITTAIVGAFSAREVFVSTLALVYGIGETDDEALPLRERLKNAKTEDGKPLHTPLVGLSLLVFFALAGQCMSTLAVVRRETKTWRYPALLFAYMTTLAYLSSLLIYQGGRLFGF